MNILFKRLYSSTSGKLYVASILQRNPFVQKPLNDFERHATSYLKILENENARGVFSIPSDRNDESNILKDKLHSSPSPIKSGQNTPTHPNSMDSSRSLTQECQQSYPWLEAANTSQKSLNRLLHEKLYLVVKNKESQKWTFPTLLHPGNDEALNVVSTRCLELFYGSQIHSYHLGRFPVAHFSKPNPASDKIFFFKSQIFPPQIGSINLSLCDDYAWLSKDELSKVLEPNYFSAIQYSLSSAN